MPTGSLSSCFAVLGLPPSATPEQVRTAFHKLARAYHPDVNRTPAGRLRFVEIVDAYRQLQAGRRAAVAKRDWGRCALCRRRRVLLSALDGRSACVDCLLGRTRARRFLPLPNIVIARHLTVCALYVVCLVLLPEFLGSRDWVYAAVALLAALMGLFILAIDVLSIVNRQPRRRIPRRDGGSRIPS